MPFLRLGLQPVAPTFLIQRDPHTLPYLPRPFVIGETHFTDYQLNESTRRAATCHGLPGPLTGPALRHQLSHLEAISVKKPTLIDYRGRLADFLIWCVDRRLDWFTSEDLDQILIFMFDEWYFRGMSPEEGSKTLAALRFFDARFRRHGSLTLPRADRALQSWRLAAPTLQRLPFPWVALCAVLAYLLKKNFILIALNLLVQFRTYLRPGACDALMVGQLVRPQPEAGPQYCLWGLLLNPTECLVPGKTKLYDQAVLLDTDLWLGPFLEQLVCDRPANAPLWKVSPAMICDAFQEACTVLGLQPLQPCRYALRHGGASDDILTGRRDRLSVKIRGGWASDASLRRYGKETRLLAELKKIPRATLLFGQFAAANLEALFYGKLPVPDLPLVPPVARTRPGTQFASRGKRQRVA